MKTIIIAEAGVNHNGDISIAKKLIDVAANSGADIVKFQTFKASNLTSINAPKARYQLETTSKKESQFDMLKKLELDYNEHIELLKYCEERRIGFLSTSFDLESIDLLNKIGMKIFKIPSGEITNYPYLKQIGGLQKKVILSTGMSDLDEVRSAINILKENGTNDIVLLHCNTQYPTPFEDVNLKVISTLKNEFNLPVGYSDHTLGIEVPIAAVAMGAIVIEKHFTLDRNMEGPDHKASLEPNELKTMVSLIRNIENAIGNGIKKPSKSEFDNINIVRKSIVAARDIKKGEILTENNLTCKRPGNGITPMEWNNIIGTKASKDFKADEMISI